jgi:hypothetical protein
MKPKNDWNQNQTQRVSIGRVASDLTKYPVFSLENGLARFSPVHTRRVAPDGSTRGG